MSSFVLCYNNSILSFAIDSVITKFDTNGNLDYENNYNKLFKLDKYNICIAQLNNPWLMGAEINNIIIAFNRFSEKKVFSSLEDCCNNFIEFLNDKEVKIFDNSYHNLEMKLIFFGFGESEDCPNLYEYSFRNFDKNLSCELIIHHTLENTTNPFFYWIGDGSEYIQKYIYDSELIYDEILDIADNNQKILFQNILNNKVSLLGSSKDQYHYCIFLIQYVICKKRLHKSSPTVGNPLYGGYINSLEGFIWVDQYNT